jgi:hypothetical protein
MSAADERARMRRALEQSGNAWLLQYWGAQVEEGLQQVVDDFGAFVTEYARRFGGETPDPFTLLDRNPDKGRAFFQVDTLTASVEMKIMVWRILLGCDIQRIAFHYDVARGTELTVTLRTPYGEEEQYRGQQGRDFKVLRHFGATGVDGHLVLQGYYALN